MAIDDRELCSRSRKALRNPTQDANAEGGPLYPPPPPGVRARSAARASPRLLGIVSAVCFGAPLGLACVPQLHAPPRCWCTYSGHLPLEAPTRRAGRGGAALSALCSQQIGVTAKRTKNGLLPPAICYYDIDGATSIWRLWCHEANDGETPVSEFTAHLRERAAELWRNIEIDTPEPVRLQRPVTCPCSPTSPTALICTKAGAQARCAP
jgi:hypothetical protein